MVSLVWYYRPEHTERGRQPTDAPDEVFASRHRDANSVACIEDKCYVLTFNEYCRLVRPHIKLRSGYYTQFSEYHSSSPMKSWILKNVLKPIVQLQVPQAAKSARGRRGDNTVDRAADAGQRGEPGRGAQRLQATALRVPGARPLLPQDLRLQIQEDPCPEQMNSKNEPSGYRSKGRRSVSCELTRCHNFYNVFY